MKPGILLITLISFTIVTANPADTTSDKWPKVRSRGSIMRVTMENLASLRYAYNKRLRVKSGLFGTITVKFRIDEHGKVCYSEVVRSTVKDSVLEEIIRNKITRWNFDSIDVPGDTTEVVYPFVFQQHQSWFEVKVLDVDRDKFGSRNSRSIVQTMYDNFYKLEKIFCRESEKKSATVKVKITVDCKGKITSTVLQDMSKTAPDFDNIIKNIRKWKFGRDNSSKNYAEFPYTFTFTKKKCGKKSSAAGRK